MAVKKIVKKSKPKKRQVKRPTQNQSVKQTVIIQQAPAPKRRRRSAPKKSARDKFDVPSSGLGVVTNLIEKIVNLQSEQSKVNKGLTQIQEDKELLKIEDAPAPQTVTSIEPPDATKRSESYMSNVPSVTGTTFSVKTGVSRSSSQDLSGFPKSILSNPISKVKNLSSLTDTKTTKAKPFFQSAMISRKTPETKSNPTPKVEGLTSLTDEKTTKADPTLPEPLDMPPPPPLKRQSSAERAVQSARDMFSSVVTSITSKKKIEPKKYDELKTKPKEKKKVERKDSLDTPPDGSSGGHKPEKELTTVSRYRTMEETEAKLLRYKNEMEQAKEELDLNLDDNQDKIVKKNYKKAVAKYQDFKEKIENKKMGKQDVDAKETPKSKLLERKKKQDERGAEERGAEEPKKKKITIKTDKEKDEQALKKLKDFADDKQRRYDRTQNPDGTDNAGFADSTITNYRSQAKRAKENYEDALAEFKKDHP